MCQVLAKEEVLGALLVLGSALLLLSVLRPSKKKLANEKLALWPLPKSFPPASSDLACAS